MVLVTWSAERTLCLVRRRRVGVGNGALVTTPVSAMGEVSFPALSTPVSAVGDMSFIPSNYCLPPSLRCYDDQSLHHQPLCW